MDWGVRVRTVNRCAATLLHGYANLLKRLDTSESVNLHKCLILLDSCQIHATRCRVAASPGARASSGRAPGSRARTHAGLISRTERAHDRGSHAAALLHRS